MNLTDFLNNQQTQQATQKWGDRLEKMGIRDKLDAIWSIATTIGFCDLTGQLKTLSQAGEEYGCLLEECPESEEFLSLLEKGKPTIEDLLAVMASLTAQLHAGFYKGDES